MEKLIKTTESKISREYERINFNSSMKREAKEIGNCTKFLEDFKSKCEPDNEKCKKFIERWTKILGELENRFIAKKFDTEFENFKKKFKKGIEDCLKYFNSQRDIKQNSENVVWLVSQIKEKVPEFYKDNARIKDFIENAEERAKNIGDEIFEAKFDQSSKGVIKTCEKNLKLIERDFRFVHDVEKYCAKMEKEFYDLEKTIPEKCQDNVVIKTKMDEMRKMVETAQKKRIESVLKKEMDGIKREIGSLLDRAKNELYHNKDDKARENIMKAKEKCKSQIENNPKFFSSLDLLESFLEETYLRIDEIDGNIMEYKTKRKIDTNKREILSEFNNLKTNSQKEYFEKARMNLAKAEEKLENLKDDNYVSTHQAFLDFKFEFQKKMDESKKLLKESLDKHDLKKIISSFDYELSSANQQKTRSQELTMTHLQNAKDKANEILGERYLNNPITQPMCKSFNQTKMKSLKEFEQSWLESILKDELKKAKEEFNRLVGEAKSKFGDGSGSFVALGLEVFAKAKEEQTKIIFNEKFLKIQGGEQMVEAFKKESNEQITAFEKHVQTRVTENEVKRLIELSKSNLSNAKIFFDKNNDDMAIKYMNDSEEMKNDLQDHPVFSKHAKVVAYIKEFDQEKSKFFSQLRERIYNDKYKKITQNIDRYFSAVDTFIKKEQFESALTEISKIQNLLLEFSKEFPDKTDKVEEFNNKVFSKKTQVKKSSDDYDFKKVLDKIETSLKNAKSMITKPTCLEYLSKAEDQVKEVELDARFSERKEFKKEELTKRIQDLKNQFSMTVHKDKIRKLKSNINDAYGRAESNLNNKKFTKCLEELSNCKKKIEDLSMDVDVGSNDDVKKYINEMLDKIKKFREGAEKDININCILDIKGKLEVNIRMAMSSSETSQNLTTLQFLKSAADDMAELRQYDVEETYFNERNKEIGAIKNTMFKKQYDRQIKKKIENCKLQLNNAKMYFKKHNYETSLTFYNKAKDEMINLIEDEKLFAIHEVKSFVDIIKKDIKKFKDDYDKFFVKDTVKKLKQTVGEKFSQAKSSLIQYNRPEESLKTLGEVEDLLIELLLYKFKDKSIASFVDKSRKDVADRKAEIMERSFKKEIQMKIDSVFLDLKNARVFFERNTMDQALELIEKTMEIVEELGGEQYVGVKIVEDFFKKYTADKKKLQAEIGKSMNKKRILDIKTSINSLFNFCRLFLKKEDKDNVVEYISKLKTEISAVKNDDTIFSVQEVEDFIKKSETDLTAFEKEFINKIYEKEINIKIKKINELRNFCKIYLGKELFGKALEHFEEAKEIMNELKENYGKSDIVKNFKDNFKHFDDSFSKQFAEKSLTKEGKKLQYNVQDSLRLFNQMFSNGAIAKSLEYLQRSRKWIEDTENKMVLKLEYVENAVKEIEKCEKLYADTIMKEEIQKKVEEARREVKKVELLQKRELKSKSRETFRENVLVKINELKEVPFVEQSTEAKMEIEKIKKIGLKLGINMDEVEKKLSSNIKQGGLFPKVLLPLKMNFKRFPVDMNIKPGLFSRVQGYNKKAGNLNGKVREFERFVAKISKDLYTHYALHTQDQLVTIGLGDNFGYDGGFINIKKDVLRYLVASGEWNCITKEEAEEDIVKKIKHEEEKFLVAWEKNQGVLKHVRTIQDIMCELQERIEDTLDRYQITIYCFNNGSMPTGIKKSQGLREHYLGKEPLLRYDYFDESKNVPFKKACNLKYPYRDKYVEGETDYNILLHIADEYKQIVKDIKENCEKYKGFPFSDIIPSLELNIKDCYRNHAFHCIGHIAYKNEHDTRSYWNALRRFPIAKKKALDLLLMSRYDTHYSDGIHRIEKGKAQIFDEYLKEKIVAPSDKVEENQWDYIPYTNITPSPKNPYGPHSEEKDTRKWNDLKQKNVGKIRFSKKQIPENERSDKAFCDTFRFGKDEIYARGYWEHTLHNWAIGKDKDGKFVFPAPGTKSDPDKFKNSFTCFDVQFLVFATINGKEYKQFDTEYGEIHRVINFFHDFYDKKNNMELFILQRNREKIDIFSKRENLARKLESLFVNKKICKPGKCKIKLDLRYQLKVKITNLHLMNPKLPYRNTLVSEPIATGEFTINIPKNAESLRISPFPVASSTVKNKKQIKGILIKEENMNGFPKDKPRVLDIDVHGEYFIAKRHWLFKWPMQYGLMYFLMKYFPPGAGSNYTKELVFVCLKCALTDIYDKKEAKCHMPPVTLGLGSGSKSIMVPPEFIPESIWKAMKVPRVDEGDAKEWYTDNLSDYDKKWLCKPLNKTVIY